MSGRLSTLVVALALSALAWLAVAPAQGCPHLRGNEAGTAVMPASERAVQARLPSRAEEDGLCCRPLGACVAHCVAVLAPSPWPEVVTAHPGGYPIAAVPLRAPLFASSPWRPPPVALFRSA